MRYITRLARISGFVLPITFILLVCACNFEFGDAANDGEQTVGTAVDDQVDRQGSIERSRHAFS